MSKFTVTFIDTTGIQGYVFSSNRLQENIGASYLVSAATGEWVEETLEQLGISKNQQTEPIESSGFDAELVYAGGGNALLIFKSQNIALKFTQILSKRVLIEAPGLKLLVAHEHEFEWMGNKKLYQVIQDLITEQIERQKYERVASAPLLGLGVTASCNSTLLPATDVKYDQEEENSYLISRETKHKLIAAGAANKKLQQFLANVINTYKFPYRTDHLGRSRHESSYAAVVHADGNAMGKRFQEYGQNRENRDYIQSMRELSNSIQKAGEKALIAITKTIVNSIHENKIVGKLGEFTLNAKNYIPFRPLVYGGDDTTFICEGRLGLELAALYLQELEKQPVADAIKHGKLTACAGICVVKTHYPFARAYEISEALCRESKKFVKENKLSDPEGFSALDWHLAVSGLFGSISEIRQREYYEVKYGKLNMRPVRLQSNGREWRTWEGFTQIVRQFKEDEQWCDRHNKIMALRDVLRQGPLATEKFLSNYRLEKLPEFPKHSSDVQELIKKGWLNNICGYFDAIEAIEFYLALEE